MTQRGQEAVAAFLHQVEADQGAELAAMCQCVLTGMPDDSFDSDQVIQMALAKLHNNPARSEIDRVAALSRCTS